VRRKEFAVQTVSYLRAVESVLGVQIQTIAIDAPRAPRRVDQALRAAEQALSERGISYIETPSAEVFAAIPDRVQAHLDAGRLQSTLPCANQIWMLFGFDLYRVLSEDRWVCLEVYPQATVRALGAGNYAPSRSVPTGRQREICRRSSQLGGERCMIGLTRISPHGLRHCLLNIEKGSVPRPTT
jgi:hypothetical protein